MYPSRKTGLILDNSYYCETISNTPAPAFYPLKQFFLIARIMMEFYVISSDELNYKRR